MHLLMIHRLIIINHDKYIVVEQNTATRTKTLRCRCGVNSSGFDHGDNTPDARNGFLCSGKLYILSCSNAHHQTIL